MEPEEGRTGIGRRVLDWTRSRQQRKGLRPRDAATLIAVAWIATILIFGFFERLLDPKTFHTVWLGDWWALQTVTTVGYGDVVPETSMGKLVASVLLLGGMAFLTVIIAMITGGFVSLYQRQAVAAGEDPYMKSMETLTLELRQVRTELHAIQEHLGGRTAPPSAGENPPQPSI
jgi:voltage-gated potassium channel Kch